MSTKNQTPHPRITLVGAGPGNPDLITIKAIKMLEAADVVLYDALVSSEILELIPEHIPAWSVGKRAGVHSFNQEEINTLMVEFAHQYGHVVRLKGGDPFVFGRGHEEIEFALSRGIEVDVVPGVSSIVAVPADIDIPLTRRGVSESFWVVTGTTQSGKMSKDIELACQSTATIVILMGMSRLKEIMDCFVQKGKENLPVAVIHNGTLPSRKHVVGTVCNIVDKVLQQGVEAPGLIVVGEVVKYATLPELTRSLGDQGISLAQ